MGTNGTVSMAELPQEVQLIIDRTAIFAAKNGTELIDELREVRKQDPKFSFLSPFSPPADSELSTVVARPGRSAGMGGRRF